MTTEMIHGIKKENQPRMEQDRETSGHDSPERRLVALNAAFEAARAEQAGIEFALLVDEALHLEKKTDEEDLKDLSISYLL